MASRQPLNLSPPRRRDPGAMASGEVEILDDSEDKTLAASDTTMRSTLRSTMYKYIVGERSNLISPLQLLHDVDTIIDAVQQLPGADEEVKREVLSLAAPATNCTHPPPVTSLALLLLSPGSAPETVIKVAIATLGLIVASSNQDPARDSYACLSTKLVNMSINKQRTKMRRNRCTDIVSHLLELSATLINIAVQQCTITNCQIKNCWAKVMGRGETPLLTWPSATFPPALSSFHGDCHPSHKKVAMREGVQNPLDLQASGDDLQVFEHDCLTLLGRFLLGTPDRARQAYTYRYPAARPYIWIPTMEIRRFLNDDMKMDNNMINNMLGQLFTVDMISLESWLEIKSCLHDIRSLEDAVETHVELMRTELITPLTPRNITGEPSVPDNGEGQAEETVLAQAADYVPVCTPGIPTDVQTQPDNELAVDTAETGHTDACNSGSLSDPSTPDLILSSPISNNTTLDITEGIEANATENNEANATVTADREDDSGSMPPLEPVQDDDATGPTGQTQPGPPTCVACLTEIRDENNICTLHCTHTLHIHCAEQWLVVSNSCPACRAECTPVTPGRTPPGTRRVVNFPNGAHLTNMPGSPTERNALQGLAGTITWNNQGSEDANSRRSTTRASRRVARHDQQDSRRATTRPTARRTRNRHSCTSCDHVHPPTTGPQSSPPPTPAMPSRRDSFANSEVLKFAFRVIVAILAGFVITSLPRANADMIDSAAPATYKDPSFIGKYRLADVLLFESYPRSVSLSMTSEEVDISILYKLKKKISDLADYAIELGGNNLITMTQAPNFCRSHGYATTLTPTLDPTLRMPHFVEIWEERNKAERLYTVTLREDSEGNRYCNYTLSYDSIFSLTSVLDLGSVYYNENRRRRYDITRHWLADPRGLPCEDKIQVHRGEIMTTDADFSLTVENKHGAVFACAEMCHNLNGLRMQSLRNSQNCILGDSCKKFTNFNCETYSWNWVHNRCRLSGKSNPRRNTNKYEGYNALTAISSCRALIQHQKSHVLVNGSLHDLSQTCLYHHQHPEATSRIYRSCKGVSHGLIADIIPLEVTLDRYLLSLTDDNKVRNPSNGSISLQSVERHKRKPGSNSTLLKANERHREKRGISSRGNTVTAALRPALSRFLTIGQTHLNSGIGMRFLSSAFPLASLMLLTANLVSLAVNLAVDLGPTVHHEELAHLTEPEDISFNDWSLLQSPNLFTLDPISPACKSEENIKTSDAIPELLKEIGDSLRSLQLPIDTILKDSSPLSQKVRDHIASQGGNVYGFWSTFIPSRQAIVRYYIYKVNGDENTISRQTTIVSGSSTSPVMEGTIIQGGLTKPGTLEPSWSCVEYITDPDTNKKNSTWLPPSCYKAPVNHQDPIFHTSFLPNARIYRIFGPHRAEYSCPMSASGALVARGLFVVLVPNNCMFSINSAEMRPADPSSRSAWTKPLVLVDKTEEYPATSDTSYPKSLEKAITSLANKSLAPAISNLDTLAQNSREEMNNNDATLGATLLTLAIIVFLAIGCVAKKLGCEGLTKYFSGEFFTARLASSRSARPRRTPDTDELDQQPRLSAELDQQARLSIDNGRDSPVFTRP